MGLRELHPNSNPNYKTEWKERFFYFNVVLILYFLSLHLQRGCACQVPGGVRANFESVHLNFNEVLVFQGNSGSLLMKREKIDSMNRNELITQDNIKVMNECILYLGGVTFMSRNEYN